MATSLRNFAPEIENNLAHFGFAPTFIKKMKKSNITTIIRAVAKLKPEKVRQCIEDGSVPRRFLTDIRMFQKSFSLQGIVKCWELILKPEDFSAEFMPYVNTLRLTPLHPVWNRLQSLRNNASNPICSWDLGRCFHSAVALPTSLPSKVTPWWILVL